MDSFFNTTQLHFCTYYNNQTPQAPGFGLVSPDPLLLWVGPGQKTWVKCNNKRRTTQCPSVTDNGLSDSLESLSKALVPSLLPSMSASVAIATMGTIPP